MAALLVALIFFAVTAIGIFTALAIALAIQFTLSRRFSVLAKAAQRTSGAELDLEFTSKGSDGLGQFTGEFNAIARKLMERGRPPPAASHYANPLYRSHNVQLYISIC